MFLHIIITTKKEQLIKSASDMNIWGIINTERDQNIIHETMNDLEHYRQK